MVKKLEKHIVEAFTKLGFTEEEIMNGCWLLERGGKSIAWIALHKFLERVAQRANIVFDMPQVLNCQPDEVAVCVNGMIIRGGNNNTTEITQTAWSIGEASSKNCKNEYRWAMAEKRAKDRVILKLLGVAGDMYSEEEADEFKKKPEEVEEFQKEASKEKAAKTRALNKAVKDGGDYVEPKSTISLEERFRKAKIWLENLENGSYEKANPSAIDRVNVLLSDLTNNNKDKEAEEIMTLIGVKSSLQDEIKY